MPKYEVTLMDGRVIPILSATDVLALRQASHQETTRIVIATKRGRDIDIPASSPQSIRKVKD